MVMSQYKPSNGHGMAEILLPKPLCIYRREGDILGSKYGHITTFLTPSSIFPFVCLLINMNDLLAYLGLILNKYCWKLY